MPYFYRDNIDFYFEEYGSGSPFIISHGLGGNLAQIRELIGELPNISLILYDNRGHGRTSAVGDPKKLNFSEMADDMAALLDRLGIPAAFIGGVSMGAGIALAFSRRHRDRARGFILSRPAWLNVPNPPNLSILGTIADLVEKHGSKSALQLFRNSETFISLKECFPETARSLIELFSPSSIEKIVLPLRFIPASVPFESFDQLQSIVEPTLVVANHKDPVHPFEYAERLTSAIPSAALREIPSKSVSVEEHRHQFQRLLTEFLSGVT
jgi:3-oxoadipate enol-lactonase